MLPPLSVTYTVLSAGAVEMTAPVLTSETFILKVRDVGTYPLTTVTLVTVLPMPAPMFTSDAKAPENTATSRRTP